MFYQKLPRIPPPAKASAARCFGRNPRRTRARARRQRRNNTGEKISWAAKWSGLRLIGNRGQRSDPGVMPVINSHFEAGELDAGNMAVHPDRLVSSSVAIPFIVEMVAEIIGGGEAAIRSAIGRAATDPLGQD